MNRWSKRHRARSEFLSSASTETLLARISYGGRKGQSAQRRLKSKGFYVYKNVEIRVDGMHFQGLQSISYES